MRCAEAMSLIWHTGHSEENPFAGRMRKNGREAERVPPGHVVEEFARRILR